MKKILFGIVGVGGDCPLDIDQDGRKAGQKTVFSVQSDGYCGPICAGHLAILVKSELEKQAKAEPPKDAPVIAARKEPAKEPPVAQVANGPAVKTA